MTCVQISDGWEDYLQPLGGEYAQILEDNFWDLVIKSESTNPNEEEWV